MSDAAPALQESLRTGLPRAAAEACGFCGSDKASPAIDAVEDWFFGCVDEPSEFVRCADCGSLWQPRPLAPESLPAAYASYYTHDEHGDGLFDARVRGRLRRHYAASRLSDRPSAIDRLGGLLFTTVSGEPAQIDAALRFAPRAPARVLDYGCGSGLFLQRLRAFGHTVEGVDFDPVAVAAVRAAEIPCHTPDEAAALDWAGRFDAITLSHVIEHVHEPRSLLRRLSGWLRPGGALFVECPNADATGLALFGRYWRGLEAPRHLAIPTPGGLDRALDQARLVASRRIVRAGVRAWMWTDSLGVMPEADRPAARAEMAAAEPESLANAEFITLVAQKVAA